MQSTAIPLSKSKVIGLLIISLAFIFLGYWLYGLDASEIQANRKFNNPAFVHGIGLANFIMGILGAVVAVRKLLDSAPGLILNEKGLTDNSSAFSAGFIPWSEITGIEVRQIQKQRLMYILLTDPESYIKKFTPIRQIFLRLSMKMAPSPVAVISSSLTVSFDELVSLVTKHLEAQKKSA